MNISVKLKNYSLSLLQLENLASEYYGLVMADTANLEEVDLEFQTTLDGSKFQKVLDLTYLKK
jgi:hypothetical protein